MDKEKLTALIRKSREGDMDAIEALLRYAHTSVSFQCRKMLRNEQDAEDVTQEVLITVYTKLGDLQNPAAFSGWLNRITASRCLNALSRGPKELQFAEDEEGSSVLENLEDLDEQRIPDKALDNAETARMIEELVDALPETQRVCTLLYYYDGMSVGQIARIMGTTENTVKSRLNYARKSIKEGVLDYEKQGIKLYGLSPLPFLLYFLRRAAAGSANAAASKAAAKAAMAAAGAGKAASSAGAAGNAGAAASGVLGGLGVKIAAGALAAVVALGGIGAAVVAMTGREESAPVSSGTFPDTSSDAVGETGDETEVTEQAETEEVVKPVEDDMFPELLQGGLTKEQLCGVLMIAPKDFSGGMFTDEEFGSQMLMPIVKYAEELGITTWYTENWAPAVYVEEANRVISVLTDYRITAENQPGYVQGGQLALYPAGGKNGGVNITSANYTSREMVIEFHYYWDSPSPADPDMEADYVAVLEPNENGLFQIRRIYGIGENTDAAEPGIVAWNIQYLELLASAGEQVYKDPNSSFQISIEPDVMYRLCDLNGNGAPELVLTAYPSTDEPGYGTQSMRNSWLGIYSCDGGEMELIYESVVYMAGYLWRESGNSLIVTSTDTFSGVTTYYALSWTGGAAAMEKLCEAQVFTPEDREAFNSEWGFSSLEVCEADDPSLIVGYGQS